MIYGLLFGEKQTHFFKSPFHLEKKDIILKICKYVLINELYKNKSFNGEKSLGINALLLPNYKKNSWFKKIQRKWTFKFVNYCRFWSKPTMHLPYSSYYRSRMG